jgi:hypothetical protein
MRVGDQTFHICLQIGFVFVQLTHRSLNLYRHCPSCPVKQRCCQDASEMDSSDFGLSDDDHGPQSVRRAMASIIEQSSTDRMKSKRVAKTLKILRTLHPPTTIDSTGTTYSNASPRKHCESTHVTSESYTLCGRVLSNSY